MKSIEFQILIINRAAAENTTNPIPESSCGESIHLHEMKDLYGDATTSDS
jgi:hypothetical protein